MRNHLGNEVGCVVIYRGDRPYIVLYNAKGISIDLDREHLGAWIVALQEAQNGLGQ